MLLKLLILLPLTGLTAFAADLSPTTGFIYPKINNGEDVAAEPAYRFQRQVLEGVAGARTAVSRYQDMEGKEVVFESVEYVGGDLKRYVFKQRQINQEASFEVRGTKGLFTLKKQVKGKGEKIETASRDLEPEVVVIDQLIDKMREKWASLMKGDDYEFRFVVVFNKDVYGFEVFKDKEIDYGGKPAVVFKMKPSSFFISMFVRPLYLTFERDGERRILEVDGRMPIKHFSDDGSGDYSDIEAILRFKYR